MSALFCQACSDEGTQADAFGFCLDCNEYLCQECHKIHCKLRKMRHHRLIEGEDMLKHKPDMVTDDACTDICPGHPGENIKYYCADHDIVGCSVCMITDHRNCAGVDHIPQVVQELSDTEDWKTIDDIEPLVTRLDQVITTSKTNIGDIQERDTQSKLAIKKFRAEINAVLDKLENASTDEAEMHRADGVEKMNSYIDHAGDFVKRLRVLKAKVSQFKEQKQYCKLFIAVKELQKVEEKIKETLEEMEVGNCIKTVAFETDRKLLDCSNAMKSLGTFSETTQSQLNAIENSSENADSIKDITKQSASIEVGITRDQDACALSITDEKVFNNVASLTILSDDRVVIAETENYALKMVNAKKNKIMSKLHLDTKINFEKENYDYYMVYPYAVVKLNENSVAVAVKNKGIVIVQAKSQLIVERVLIDSRTSAISFCNRSGYIYFCCDANTSIFEVNLQGRCTTVLAMKKDRDGNSQYPISSAANRTLASAGYLYTVVRVNRGQTGRTKVLAMVLPDGSIKEEIDLPADPEVLESDETGSVLFILAKDIIYVMKVGSTKPMVLLTKDDGLCNAQILAYDNNSKKLYVGMKNNNFINVYKLAGI